MSSEEYCYTQMGDTTISSKTIIVRSPQTSLIPRPIFF